ncbi:hypothetical protein L207DRAFT_633832 [Hyaloscypha variabilis F]|uniref:DUF6590 domain-containing protein n=1 Tax=Hyaloscypha variabilis (strain UAMH 11265 / GT02V1 / F) TaxID=1149755 RepID=A0A2J6RQU4_HYAVF|nr:hypothetical protein L207DRAFT_633832 [Hyaloscypha variabilis F]
MEAVRITSNFAGILTIVGQSIDGILKLKAFFEDVSTAPQRFEDLLKDISDLQDVMIQIQEFVDLLGREPAEKLQGTNTPKTTILQANLTSCATDIEAWVQLTGKMNPRTETGIRGFFRKVKVAADKRGFEQFGKKISSHQQRIGLNLSVLGRSFDYLGLERLQALGNKFDGLAETNVELNNRMNERLTSENQIIPNTKEILTSALDEQFQPLKQFISQSLDERFEDMSQAHSESHESIRSISQSLSSLASQMSHLLSVPFHGNETKPRHPVEEHSDEVEWCCDAISGIEDGFEDNGRSMICLYCSKIFGRPSKYDDGIDKLGYHLTKAHNFGLCNLSISYTVWEELHEHLVDFHAMGRNIPIPRRSRFYRHRSTPIYSRGQSFINEQPPRPQQEYCETDVLLQCRLSTAHWHLSSEHPLLTNDIVSFDQIASLLHKFERESLFTTPPHEIWRQIPEVACLWESIILVTTDEGIDMMASSWSAEKDNGPFRDLLHGSYFCEGLRENKRSQINQWLLEILCESAPTRDLLRSGQILPEMECRGTGWLQSILEWWEQDEAATGEAGDLIFRRSSNRAVDSRDNCGNDECSSGSASQGSPPNSFAVPQNEFRPIATPDTADLMTHPEDNSTIQNEEESALSLTEHVLGNSHRLTSKARRLVSELTKLRKETIVHEICARQKRRELGFKWNDVSSVDEKFLGEVQKLRAQGKLGLFPDLLTLAKDSQQARQNIAHIEAEYSEIAKNLEIKFSELQLVEESMLECLDEVVLATGVLSNSPSISTSQHRSSSPISNSQYSTQDDGRVRMREFEQEPQPQKRHFVKQDVKPGNDKKFPIARQLEFREHDRRDFRYGKVFKIRESKSLDGEDGTVVSARIEKVDDSLPQKIRRFVVIEAKHAYCVCLSIMSHKGRPTPKDGGHPENYAVIYIEGQPPPSPPSKTELARPAIKMKTQVPYHKLEMDSRLNYERTYHVDYNVKVLFIGDISKVSESDLFEAYRYFHPSDKLRSESPPPLTSDTNSTTSGMREPPSPKFGTGHIDRYSFDTVHFSALSQYSMDSGSHILPQLSHGGYVKPSWEDPQEEGSGAKC